MTTVPGRALRAGWLLVALMASGCTEPASDGLHLSDRSDLVLQVVPGIRPPLGDPATVRAAAVSGDRLTLELQHAGGCRVHRYALATDGEEGLSLPPTYTLYLAHDADGDRCEALLTVRLRVDLRPLRAVASPGGVLLLRLVEPDGRPADVGELRYQY